MEAQDNTLHRKQYLMGTQELSKIDEIRSRTSKSAAEVVRDAVRAYDPSSSDTEEITPELVEFLSQELSTAIEATQAANAKVESVLGKLENK
jgi:Arc/MetJ-type ribon-helix-helix transcriptional regulator